MAKYTALYEKYVVSGSDQYPIYQHSSAPASRVHQPAPVIYQRNRKPGENPFEVPYGVVDEVTYEPSVVTDVIEEEVSCLKLLLDLLDSLKQKP